MPLLFRIDNGSTGQFVAFGKQAQLDKNQMPLYRVLDADPPTLEAVPNQEFPAILRWIPYAEYTGPETMSVRGFRSTFKVKASSAAAR